MTATITKVHPLRSSRTERSYLRIEFITDKGGVAVTDIVPGYRNARRWVPIIKSGEGTRVKGLKEKWPGTIDADSQPKIV